MNTIDTLIVVDTDRALASGTLSGNAYLFDTNGFIGSWGEGTSELNTVCQDGQPVTWGAASIRPDGAVAITGFSGPMVDRGICNPKASGPVTDAAWSGFVEARGRFAAFAYTVAMSVGGEVMSLTAALKVA